MYNHCEYTLKEEILNSLTHGIGVGLGIAALVIMVVCADRQCDAWRIVSGSTFGTTIIIMYLSSTLYHSFPQPHIKHIFKIMDHASIYLLIAGSYTPFCLVTLRGGWGWTLFGITWGLALIGVFFKTFFVYRFEILSTIIYVLIGWLAIIAIDPIYHALPFGGLVWLVLGGLCYTIGVIFYAWESKTYMHSVWHVFVLAGTICHFFGVLFYVIL